MTRKRYRITIEMETPYNPNKWDWEELIASQDGEYLSYVAVNEIGEAEQQ